MIADVRKNKSIPLPDEFFQNPSLSEMKAAMVIYFERSGEIRMSSEIDEDRFVTEARISANINHPNIIQCYRFGKYRGKVSYIEMEYVDGVNLYYLINSNGKLPVPVAL